MLCSPSDHHQPVHTQWRPLPLPCVSQAGGTTFEASIPSGGTISATLPSGARIVASVGVENMTPSSISNISETSSSPGLPTEIPAFPGIPATTLAAAAKDILESGLMDVLIDTMAAYMVEDTQPQQQQQRLRPNEESDGYGYGDNSSNEISDRLAETGEIW